MSGSLYLVSTPIGNPDDLTLRAARILREVDAVVCEELRVGSTLLSRYQIQKPLVELNEHTEVDAVAPLVERLARGENLALVSDHGTPLVSDPGELLVRRALEVNARLVPIPGASSIIAALVVSGLSATRFRFLGQLPPKTEQRRRALSKLKHTRETMILLDAPYRLMPLLKSVNESFGSVRRVAVACNLTMPDERIVRDVLAMVIEEFTARPFKGEFVLVVAGASKRDLES